MSSNYSTSNNHGDSVVDIDYLSADNNDAVLWSARMALAAAEEGQAPVGGNASASNHNSNSNNNNNANSNSNSNPNEQYGAMNGFRRLHRDYLRDLEDQVVMGLPWPTPSNRQEVSDLLRRRSLSKTRANQISTCVFGYCVVSIGFWLLYGVVLGADIQGEDNEGKNNINNNNNNNKGFLTVLLGISYVGALVMMMYGHIRYYRLDGKVQFLVRAIMDANGLGYRDPYGEHPELLRTDTNQRAQFRLPEFVDVILRTVAAEDTNSLDDEFSTVTFRDSIMKSVTSGSAGTHHTGTGAETGNAAVRWSRRIWGYGSR